MRFMLPPFWRIFRKRRARYYDLHPLAELLRMIADILDRAAEELQ